MSTKSSARIKQKRRAGEPWISTNRVLNASKKGSFGRNPNFDTDETKLLIQLWGDPKVQRTLITTHKKHAVICQLATRMQEYGYYRSAEEITTRIKNLKCFYNRLKKDMEAGQTSTTEPTWKHFAEMDAIMTRPIFSVRPNEVPAPSLKYQLEKAREEREERRRKILDEGGVVSESDEGLDDIIALAKANNAKNEIDDGIIPDVEVDIDINDEAFVAICGNASDKSNPDKIIKRRKLIRTNEDSLGDMSELESELEMATNKELTDAMSDKYIQIKEENESNDSEVITPPISTTTTTANVNPAITNGENKSASTTPPKTAATNRWFKGTTNSRDNENEKNSNMSAALLIPKQEPIDVDAEDDSNDKDITSTSVKALMPTLADILQMSKGNMSISSSSVVIPVTSVTTIAGGGSSVNTALTNVAAATPTSIVTAQSTQQGKISLVPTNFLMQPKTTTSVTTPLTLPQQQTQQKQIHLLPNSISQQPRILLSGTTGAQSSAATPTNTGIVTTGPGGMKVLLLNAEQANKMCANAAATTGLAQQINTQLLPLNNTLLQQQHQKQALHQHQQQQQQQQKQQIEQQQKKRQQREEREKNKREELMSKKDATGMRILLRQLLNAQTENNEVQKQRLALERERLDFEKSIAERFLVALPKFFTQPQQQPQHSQFFQSAQMAVSGATQLRLNPPKLVFTTAVPTSMGAAVSNNTHTATILTPPAATTPGVLTTSLPKVIAPKPIEICTQINDFQLLTPKVEKDT